LVIAIPEQRAVRIDVAHLVKDIDDGNAVVVDVRDQDYKGGNIPGALHVPYEQFENNIEEVVEKFADSTKKYVLHCMYSKERGPACAEMLLAKLGKKDGKEAAAGAASSSSAGEKADEKAKRPEIFVLTGGFCGWVNHWATVDAAAKTIDVKEAKRLEAYDPTLWAVVVERGVARAVYKRDAEDSTYAIPTPMASGVAPFAASPAKK